jgi:hypothetical protein
MNWNAEAGNPEPGEQRVSRKQEQEQEQEQEVSRKQEKRVMRCWKTRPRMKQGWLSLHRWKRSAFGRFRFGLEGLHGLHQKRLHGGYVR